METLPKMRSKPTEKNLWNRIKKQLNANGDRAYRIEAVATPGFPDVVWCQQYRGPVFIELKAGPRRFRAAQLNFIREMDKIGIPVYVIWQAELRADPVVYPGVLFIPDYVPGSEFKGETFNDWYIRQKSIKS
jgi:G:T-mismatch repair DNA endonuclease (very short patch repair protein)